MPRPKKCRRVGVLPTVDSFGPLNPSQGKCDTVRMTIEEYEAVRLIDLEHMTQEGCAQSMGVSRTTVQGIYDKARTKIADAIVNGRRLHICGGHYELCADCCAAKCGGACKEEKGCDKKHGKEPGIIPIDESD